MFTHKDILSFAAASIQFPKFFPKFSLEVFTFMVVPEILSYFRLLLDSPHKFHQALNYAQT